MDFGVKQINFIVDPMMPYDKKLMDFVNDIEFSDDFKPKLKTKGSGPKT